MFCRHRNVLIRAAVPICQPSAQASRFVSTSSKTVKPKATRKPAGATKLSKSSTTPGVAGEETKKKKRAPRATKATQATKATKATTKTKTTGTKLVNDASLAEGDLAARLQAIMPWRTPDAKTRGSRTPSSVLDPGRVNVVSEKLCGKCPGCAYNHERSRTNAVQTMCLAIWESLWTVISDAT